MWIAVACLLTAASARIASAGLAETVQEDLRPISGYVVMKQGGDYLVDLDARHGLRVGDLLSVVTKGKEVVHPLSKEVIGRLDEAKAVLQVVQMKTGFSVARPLTEPTDIVDGDLVRRFALLTAVFRGPAGRGKELYDELRKSLPELEWQGFFPSGEGGGGPRADLVFSLENQELRMLDREGHPLRTWAYAPAAEQARREAVAEGPGKAGGPGPVPSAAAPVPGPAGKGSAPVLWSTGEGVDFGPFASLGELPSRILMAAFTRFQDRILLAAVDGRYIRVFDVSAGLRQLAVAEMRNVSVSPLAVAWWKPGKESPLHLAVTAGEEISESSGMIVKTEPAGALYEFDGRSLRLEVSGIRYLLGTFDRDGDGDPETLLGQEFNLKTELGGTFLLALEGEKLVADKPGFELPREFTVTGSVLADLTGDGKPEAAYVRNGVLWIYSGTEMIYRSSKEMGGTISTLTYDKNPYVKDSMISVLSLEVPPFRLDVDGDGVPELLVVASDVGILQVPGIGPGVKKSWVDVVKYQSGSFRKGRLRGDLESPIQGIWADGNQVYLVVSKTTSAFSKAGNSTLLSLPMGQGPR